MTAMKFVPSGAEILQRFIKWTCLLDQDGETEFWSDVEWLRKSMLSAVEPAPDGLVEQTLALVVGVRERIKRSPGLSSEPFSDKGWAVIEAAMRSALTSRAAVDGQPVAWVRFCSDGTYEGPLMDCAIEDVRKKSGAWTPLYKPASRAAVLEEAAKNDARYRWLRENDGGKRVVINWNIGHDWVSSEDIDAEIDAAIRAAKGE